MASPPSGPSPGCRSGDERAPSWDESGRIYGLGGAAAGSVAAASRGVGGVERHPLAPRARRRGGPPIVPRASPAWGLAVATGSRIGGRQAPALRGSHGSSLQRRVRSASASSHVSCWKRTMSTTGCVVGTSRASQPSSASARIARRRAPPRAPPLRARSNATDGSIAAR